MGKAAEIKAWDLFVRVFHWMLVSGFFIAYLVEDEMLGLHVWSGYLVFSLVMLRVVWGVAGSTHARFSDFIFGPGEIVRYMKRLISFDPPRYIGHNPAGGAMIILLLMSVTLIALTGMVLYGAEAQTGLLSDLAGALGMVGEQATEALEEVHEFFANLTLFLAGIHIGGVLLGSLLHNENLVRSMFNGRKRS